MPGQSTVTKECGMSLWFRPLTMGRMFVRQNRWAVVAASCLLAAGVLPAAAQTPVTADQVVQMALQKNPTVQSAEQDIKVAGGALTSARSAVLPSLTLGQNYTHNYLPEATRIDINTGQVIRGNIESWNGNLTLSQSFVDFSGWAGIRSAKANLEAAAGNTSATRATVALQAYTQFYTVLKAMKLTTVARQALQLAQDQLKRTNALFELGSVAKGDVLKQQVNVSQSQLDEINARTAVEVERARLVSFLGLDPGNRLEIDTTLTESTVNVDSATVWKDAFANRPELIAARADLASARASLGGAQGRRYPTVDGSWSYSYSQNLRFPQRLEEMDANSVRRLGLSLNFPIFDGRFTKGQINEAKARELQAEYNLRTQELVIAVDVNTSLQSAYQAAERIHVTRDGLASAEEDLKLSQEKYNVGSATVLDLIDAQVALTRARSDYISALADAYVAQMQLRRARGEKF
ncbi:MAG TPA: TolC family protein [Candidatus Eisenbacteria bacterium]|nr:TolC family protein [Candidatus Eisenbacteria bacterium]